MSIGVTLHAGEEPPRGHATYFEHDGLRWLGVTFGAGAEQLTAIFPACRARDLQRTIGALMREVGAIADKEDAAVLADARQIVVDAVNGAEVDA